MTIALNNVVAVVTGAAGGIGRYRLSIAEQSAASTTISGTYGLLTLGATATGFIPVGSRVTSSTLSAGATVTQPLSGDGKASGSTFAIDSNTAVGGGGETMTFTKNVATKWLALSGAAAGELIKIAPIRFA